jgi:hypothetical protein
VLCGVVHAFEGWDVILQKWGGGKGLGSKTRRILAGVGIGTVLSGLFYAATEPLLVLQSTLARINASYLALAIYRVNGVRNFVSVLRYIIDENVVQA